MSDEADSEEREFWEEPEDPWPDEPDEFDPHSLGPEIPSAPDPTSDDVEISADLLKAFWSAVLFANVGLLGVSLGPMLVFFEGRTDAGLAAFLIGVLGLVFAYRRYHGYVHRDEGDDGDTGDTGDDGDGEGDGGVGDDRDDEAGRNDEHTASGAGGRTGPANTTDAADPTDTDRERDRRGPGGGD